MGKKLIILLLVVAGLASASAVYVSGGLQAYARYQQASLADQHHCGGLLPVRVCVRAPAALFSAFYPSYLKAGSSVVDVFYSSEAAPQRLQISVSIAGFSQVETRLVTATAGMQSAAFLPALATDVLPGLTADRHTLIQVSVRDQQGVFYYTNAIPLLLHSRRLMNWTAADRLRIAAWVTPQAPAVHALVRRASAYLERQPAPAPTAMVGYSNVFPRQVIDQVDALFDALRLSYHLRAQPGGVPSGGPEGTGAATQSIRLPFEVLQGHSAGEIELTLLLASAAESIGLHAEIVVVPGRTFLGVALSPDDQQFAYWDALELNAGVTGDAAGIASDALYAQNAKRGTVLDKILISDARQAGVLPML